MEARTPHTENLRLAAARGEPFALDVDGQPVTAYQGETVAAALIAAGYRTFRHTAHGLPRGLFCGMGVCFDCLVTVDGRPHVRACLTLVQPGMRVRLTGGSA
jgi:predicted molibdopterin-dependent oxidoreductase YjgC